MKELIVHTMMYKSSLRYQKNTWVRFQRGSETQLFCLFTGVMGEYEPKIEVQFPEIVPTAKGATVKLECFALGK